ncbi:cytochrome c [Myxococcota bacterium]|nr:cytochrome c [Myxococcota bacterium]
MRFALIAFTLAFTAACGDKDTGTDSGGDSNSEVDAILALTGDATAGGTTFANTCAACHGADGASGYAANLVEEIPEKDDAFIVDIVINGDGGGMPAQDLSDQEVADVLAYVRATFG